VSVDDNLRHLLQTIGHLTQGSRPKIGLSVSDEMRLRADVRSAKQWYDTFKMGDKTLRDRGR
jgi:hypothetical protein